MDDRTLKEEILYFVGTIVLPQFILLIVPDTSLVDKTATNSSLRKKRVHSEGMVRHSGRGMVAGATCGW